jgi:hypothetical protein
MPIKSIFSRPWYKVGTSSVSLVGLSSLVPNCREIPGREGCGQHVSLRLRLRLRLHQCCCVAFCFRLLPDNRCVIYVCISAYFNIVWMLGNLARATYVGSSDFVWPFSYNQCSADKRKSQEINACSKVNHYGLDSFRGRGAPEIDLIESMQGEKGKLPNTHIQRPYQSASLQIAPGIEIDRPVLGKLPHKVRALSFLS